MQITFSSQSVFEKKGPTMFVYVFTRPITEIMTVLYTIQINGTIITKLNIVK